jgi:hypothetical protein
MEMYSDSCEVKLNLYRSMLCRKMWTDYVISVPGYRTRCIVFPVGYEFNLYMLCRRK